MIRERETSVECDIINRAAECDSIETVVERDK